MLNELANYCVPDLNTVLFGTCLLTSDFHTIIETIESLLQYKNAYCTVNGVSIEDGLSLSLSLSLSL